MFGSGARADDVAGRWYTSYNEDKAAAVKDLVNCVLQAAGCQHQITEDDVNDPDNCENRLAELQSLYEDVSLLAGFVPAHPCTTPQDPALHDPCRDLASNA